MPSDSGTQMSTQADSRPSADSARTWRRSRARSRMVSTLVCRISARLPPTSRWIRTAMTAQTQVLAAGALRHPLQRVGQVGRRAGVRPAPGRTRRRPAAVPRGPGRRAPAAARSPTAASRSRAAARRGAARRTAGTAGRPAPSGRPRWPAKPTPGRPAPADPADRRVRTGSPAAMVIRVRSSSHSCGRHPCRRGRGAGRCGPPSWRSAPRVALAARAVRAMPSTGRSRSGPAPARRPGPAGRARTGRSA